MQSAAAASSSQSHETSLAHKRDAVLQLAPLQTKRPTFDETGDAGARFNARLPVPGEQGPQTFSSGQEPREGHPASVPSRASAYQRSLSIPEPPRRSRSIPAVLRDCSGPESPAQVLKKERKYKAEMGASFRADTLSPHLAAMIGKISSNETLIDRIADMAPGGAEIRAGFLPVKLARSFDSLSPDKPAKERLGSGRYGIVYAVRLLEDFIVGKNVNHGRDFVFKAMLSTDRDNPLSQILYSRLPDDHTPDDLEKAVSLEMGTIFNEFKIAASLAHTSRVMQVYGLVQIGDEFGILAEKINGETAQNLLKKSLEGLRKGTITAQEYLTFAGQAVGDVLVGISRFADQGVTHLDISHNNVLYDKNLKHFKLVDMGKGREQGAAKEMGTRGYIDIGTSVADPKNDVYSAGQLLAYFLRDPATTVGLAGILGNLTVDNFPFMSRLKTLPLEKKTEVVDLIRHMTKIPAADRPSAQEILSHRFINSPRSRDQIHAFYEKLNELPGGSMAEETMSRSAESPGSPGTEDPLPALPRAVAAETSRAPPTSP